MRDIVFSRGGRSSCLWLSKELPSYAIPYFSGIDMSDEEKRGRDDVLAEEQGPGLESLRGVLSVFADRAIHASLAKLASRCLFS